MPRMPRLEYSNAIYHIVARGDYAYSSFGGYARKSRQVDWIAFDEHQRYWLRRNGGKTRLCPTERSLRKDLLTQPIRRSNDSKIEFTENRIS